MLTKATVKFIKSLQLKKNRVEHQCFLVEGAKSVLELLNSEYEVELIVCTDRFIQYNKKLSSQRFNIFTVKDSEIPPISTFKSNNSAVAVARMRKENGYSLPNDRYVIALDDIRDPGNLGTIIRIADWYDITDIVASSTTADFYNPKVISSSMGSFTRISVHYGDLSDFLKNYNGSIYGAMMEGESIHSISFKKNGVLVMGNESNGISDRVSELITDCITIPRHGGAESLNVAVSTAIICDRIVS